MKTLFEQTKLGNISVQNRFLRSATWENMTTEDGQLTDKLYKIYENLAKSGVGLIITGYANIVKEEQPNHGMMGIYDDSFIDEYKKLTNIVHNYNSKIIMQVAYGGTKTKFNLGKRIIYAPSEVAERSTNVVGKAMAKEDINYIINAFANAAKRIQESGFDGIEIHGAHTYLINQFLSPYYNRRTDEYGGSLDNRMRFLLEIYNKVREKVGDKFTILIKLTASEFFQGGLTFDETKLICKKLEEVGVDAIEITGNIHGKAKSMVGEVFDGYRIQEEGYFIEYAKIISNEINIPIITVGGFKNIDKIEKLLNETNIDFFGLSRPLLAEPDLIKRWKSGDRKAAICLSCSKCRTSKGNYCTIFNTCIK
ncbi:NADH:flavin oxidoreductase [Clostridium pasteurianum]|uniref:NADH:flavin oxidoreductase n=1 Tax=Clostridium pasteurianum TaxID=1501 RepID=UPI00226096A4|nr:NADH:flavin oxidoreductase [Clostridium pasteurianum]UZW13034.1 NADH:flavin oxidoreductase [Clostridium pasteurianum]